MHVDKYSNCMVSVCVCVVLAASNLEVKVYQTGYIDKEGTLHIVDEDDLEGVSQVIFAVLVSAHVRSSLPCWLVHVHASPYGRQSGHLSGKAKTVSVDTLNTYSKFCQLPAQTTHS